VLLVSEHPLWLAGFNNMYCTKGVVEVCRGASAGFASRWDLFGPLGNMDYMSIGVCPYGKCAKCVLQYDGKSYKVVCENTELCGQILDLKYDLDLALISIKAVLNQDSPGVRIIFNVDVECVLNIGYSCVYYRDIPGNIRAGVPFYVHIITHPAFIAYDKGRWKFDPPVYPWKSE